MIKNLAPVSVVIPCYRASKTIERAVYSVAKQTWLPYEVIIVDDGSDDDTVDVLKRMQCLYGSDWIRLVCLEKNYGPAFARNVGWDLSSQPYIAFLDSDDSWHPLKIEIQLSYMLQNPEITLTSHKYKYVSKQEILEIHHISLESIEIQPISPKKLLFSNKISTPTVIVKREIPFRFEATKKFSEDYLLWLSILLSGHKGHFINTVLTYLYKRPYGEGGLSAKLWKMELGELDTYWQLWKHRKISFPFLAVLIPWSMVKYVRRLITTKIK